MTNGQANSGFGFDGNPNKDFSVAIAVPEPDVWYDCVIQDCWKNDGQFGSQLCLDCSLTDEKTSSKLNYQFFINMKSQIDSPFHRFLCALWGEDKAKTGVVRKDFLGMQFLGLFKRVETRTGKIRYPLNRVKDSNGEAVALTGAR